MAGRKRTRADADPEDISVQSKPAQSLLVQIRNKWEFAAFYSFIYTFGDILKIDKEWDVDMLEEECLKHETSPRLAELGLHLLKHVSSHRGLTAEIFDEYTRRQFVAKDPKNNPFGEGEEPKHFTDFDVFTKLNVLYTLAVWTFWNPEKMREKMGVGERDQASWRIEHDGEDAKGNQYFVMDDNRLYRQTLPPIPPPLSKSKPKAKASKTKAKAKSKQKSKAKAKAAKPAAPEGRRSKRLKVMTIDSSESELTDLSDLSDIDTPTDDAEESDHDEVDTYDEASDYGLAGIKWECIAVTLEEYNNFLDSFKGTRNPDERALVARIKDKALPAVEAAFEAQARKAAARAKELATLEKMAFAKRSSRISARQDKEREAQAEAEAKRKREDDLKMAHKEQAKLRQMELERESRMATREQRHREREMKRILMEEEVNKLERATEDLENSEGRMSERNRQAQILKNKEELDKIKQEDEQWDFDCAGCGVHGKNHDDGRHSMQCEKCGVWQHSACYNLTPEQAEAEDFHFTCPTCKNPKPAPPANNSPPVASTEENNKPNDTNHIVVNGNSSVMINGSHNGAASTSSASQKIPKTSTQKQVVKKPAKMGSLPAWVLDPTKRRPAKMRTSEFSGSVGGQNVVQKPIYDNFIPYEPPTPHNADNKRKLDAGEVSPLKKQKTAEERRPSSSSSNKSLSGWQYVQQEHMQIPGLANKRRSSSSASRPSTSGSQAAISRPPSATGHRPPSAVGLQRPPSAAGYHRADSFNGHHRPESNAGQNRPGSNAGHQNAPRPGSFEAYFGAAAGSSPVKPSPPQHSAYPPLASSPYAASAQQSFQQTPFQQQQQQPLQSNSSPLQLKATEGNTGISFSPNSSRVSQQMPWQSTYSGAMNMQGSAAKSPTKPPSPPRASPSAPHLTPQPAVKLMPTAMASSSAAAHPGHSPVKHSPGPAVQPQLLESQDVYNNPVPGSIAVVHGSIVDVAKPA